MQNHEKYDKSVVVALKLIQKQFLCCVPINKINWMNLFNHNIDWDDQKALLDLTCNLCIVQKYPIKIEYQNKFLKFVLSKLEEQGAEIHDDVYTAIGRVMTLGEQDKYFKHYLFLNSHLVLEESPNFISKGTTGLCSWQAGIALAEWCLANKNLFQNKTVFEFGSGIGLTGLAVASGCQPKNIFLTDCHDSVLKILRDNLKLNRELSKDQTTLETVEILNFAWEEISQEFCEATSPDVLLAADVVYDSSLFSEFLNAVSYFFLGGSAKELIIACTERNERTLGDFLSLLGNYNLKYKELEVVQQHFFIWSTECPIRIYSVTSNLL